MICHAHHYRRIVGRPCKKAQSAMGGDGGSAVRLNLKYFDLTSTTCRTIFLCIWTGAEMWGSVFNYVGFNALDLWGDKFYGRNLCNGYLFPDVNLDCELIGVLASDML